MHLNTLREIQKQLSQQTAPIKYVHVYSHTNENNQEGETLSSNLKKKEKMIEKYGEENTNRYVVGNMAADKLADKGILEPEIFTLPFNKFQNNFLLQDTRKKASKKNLVPKTVINTRIRLEIKKKLKN